MSMSGETTLLDHPLACIQHQLADIALGIDAMSHDLRVLLALVQERQDLENRVWHLERLVHAALMGDEDDGDADTLSYP